MSFSIRHIKRQELELITITDEITDTEVAVLPGFGATLQAFLIKEKNGSLFNVIDSYKDGEELKRELNRSFKGPKLSPFPCRIPNGIYQFGEKEYKFGHLFPDGTAIHGLRDRQVLKFLFLLYAFPGHVRLPFLAFHA